MSKQWNFVILEHLSVPYIPSYVTFILVFSRRKPSWHMTKQIVFIKFLDTNYSLFSYYSGAIYRWNLFREWFWVWDIYTLRVEMRFCTVKEELILTACITASLRLTIWRNLQYKYKFLCFCLLNCLRIAIIIINGILRMVEMWVDT